MKFFSSTNTFDQSTINYRTGTNPDANFNDWGWDEKVLEWCLAAKEDITERRNKSKSSRFPMQFNTASSKGFYVPVWWRPEKIYYNNRKKNTLPEARKKRKDGTLPRPRRYVLHFPIGSVPTFFDSTIWGLLEMVSMHGEHTSFRRSFW